MSVETPRGTLDPKAGGYVAHREPAGAGWLGFAAVILSIVGCLNVIGGIAAIDGANVYTAHAHYMIGSLNTWGWVMTVTGVAQILAAFGVFARNQLARWVGVLFAAVNSGVHLLALPALPFFSVAMFATDLLVVFALVAYGGRQATA